MKLLSGRSVLTISLLAATSGFGAAIGSFAEANVDTSALIVTQWGIPQGSYILTLDRAAIAAANTPVGVVPTAVVTSNNTTNTTNTDTTTSRQTAPMIIMQPNLGFQVVLKADYFYEAEQQLYTAPANPIRTAANTPSTGNQPYTLTTSDVSSLGVSNTFTGAPVTGNQVSDAGALFMGDSAIPPTVLTSTATVPRGFTPTNSTTPQSGTAGATTTTPTASSVDNAPSSGSPDATPQQQIDQISAAAAVAPVPEPSTAVGISLALAGLGWLKHRSSKRK